MLVLFVKFIWITKQVSNNKQKMTTPSPSLKKGGDALLAHFYEILIIIIKFLQVNIYPQFEMTTTPAPP